MNKLLGNCFVKRQYYNGKVHGVQKKYYKNGKAFELKKYYQGKEIGKYFSLDNRENLELKLLYKFKKKKKLKEMKRI